MSRVTSRQLASHMKFRRAGNSAIDVRTFFKSLISTPVDWTETRELLCLGDDSLETDPRIRQSLSKRSHHRIRKCNECLHTAQGCLWLPLVRALSGVSTTAEQKLRANWRVRMESGGLKRLHGGGAVLVRAVTTWRMMGYQTILIWFFAQKESMSDRLPDVEE